MAGHMSAPDRAVISIIFPLRSGATRGLYHIRAMCRRYVSSLPAEFIARFFGTVNPLLNLAPREVR